MPHFVLRIFAVIAPIFGFFVLAAGYDNADPNRTTTQTGPHYSPFVVEVSGQGVLFEQITFKDVGMSVAPEDRAFVYETIAESLSSQLAEEAGMSLDVQVVYSEDTADPAFHRACGANQVYVDLWHDASSPKWGYSLWSGCGEEAQFAWRELGTSGADPATTIEPLTRDIAANLAHAVAASCFTKHC